MWKCLFDFFHVQIEKRFLCHSIFATSLKNELFLTPNENVYMLYISTSFWFSICCAKKLKKQKILSKILQKTRFCEFAPKCWSTVLFPQKLAFFFVYHYDFVSNTDQNMQFGNHFPLFIFMWWKKLPNCIKAGFIQWWSGWRPAICTLKYTTCDFVTQSQTAFFHEWV